MSSPSVRHQHSLNFCRTCLRINENDNSFKFYNVFEDFGDPNILLPFFDTVLHLNTRQDNLVSRLICEPCYDKLKEWNNMMCRAQLAQFYMNQMINDNTAEELREKINQYNDHVNFILNNNNHQQPSTSTASVVNISDDDDDNERKLHHQPSTSTSVIFYAKSDIGNNIKPTLDVQNSPKISVRQFIENYDDTDDDSNDLNIPSSDDDSNDLPTSSMIIPHIPEASSMDIPHIPEASSMDIPHIPEASSMDIPHIPETSSMIIPHVPEASSTIIPLTPETSSFYEQKNNRKIEKINRKKKDRKISLNGRKYSCTKLRCKSTFKSFSGFKRHYRSHVEKGVTCWKCVTTFANMSKMRLHQLHYKCTYPGQFRCLLCYKLFDELEFLSRHIFCVHKSDESK